MPNNARLRITDGVYFPQPDGTYDFVVRFEGSDEWIMFRGARRLESAADKERKTDDGE